jgi:hypothetical protein
MSDMSLKLRAETVLENYASATEPGGNNRGNVKLRQRASAKSL